MLENITNKITGIFQGLSNKGAITEKDLETTLREVRVALLEADVSLKVSKDLIKKIQEKAPVSYTHLTLPTIAIV